MVATRAASRKLQTADAAPPPTNTLKAPPKRAVRKKAAPPADADAEPKCAAAQPKPTTTKSRPAPAPKPTTRTRTVAKRSEPASALDKTAQKPEPVKGTRKTAAKTQAEAACKKTSAATGSRSVPKENVPKRKASTKQKAEGGRAQLPTRSISGKTTSKKAVKVTTAPAAPRDADESEDELAPTWNIPKKETLGQVAAPQELESRESGQNLVIKDVAVVQVDPEQIVPEQPTAVCDAMAIDTEDNTTAATRDNEQVNEACPSEESTLREQEELIPQDMVENGDTKPEREASPLANDAADPEHGEFDHQDTFEIAVVIPEQEVFRLTNDAADSDPETLIDQDTADNGAIPGRDVSPLPNDATNPGSTGDLDMVVAQDTVMAESTTIDDSIPLDQFSQTNRHATDEPITLEQTNAEDQDSVALVYGEPHVSSTGSEQIPTESVSVSFRALEDVHSIDDPQPVQEYVINPNVIFLNQDNARETENLDSVSLEAESYDHISKAREDETPPREVEKLERESPSKVCHFAPQDGKRETPARKAPLAQFPRPVLGFSLKPAMPLLESPIKSALRSPLKQEISPKKKTVTFDSPRSNAFDASPLVSDGPLSGTVFFLDIRSRGNIENHVFVGLLEDLGAQVISRWDNQSPTPTHVLFKDGLLETLQKVVAMNGAVKCINVGFALDCEKHNKRMDESAYLVNLDPARPKTPSPMRNRFAFTPARTPSQVFFSQTPSTVLSTPTTPNSSEWERSILYDDDMDKENSTSLSSPKLVPRSCPPKKQAVSNWLKQSPIKPATAVRPIAASARKRRFESFGGITMAAPKKLRFN